MAPLEGKKVVLIGGSSGLGFAVAKGVLANGGAVVICSSSQAKVDAALGRLGGGDRATGEALDVTNEAEVKAFFEKTGQFAHLVFTAGGELGAEFPAGELSEVKKVFDTRYWGLLSCVQQSKTYLTDSITITSGGIAHRPRAGWAARAGVAGAAISTTRNLALDLAPIRVNCITPGLVDTEMWADLPVEAKQGMFEEVAAKLPVEHAGTAEELAEAYLFAMKCSYLTGQSVTVDGGSSLV